MSRLVEWIDRLKLVEGAILIGTVFIGHQLHGVLGTVAVVVIALALILPITGGGVRECSAKEVRPVIDSATELELACLRF